MISTSPDHRPSGLPCGNRVHRGTDYWDGADLKRKASPLLCVISIGLAFVDTRFAVAVYVVVGLIWLWTEPKFPGNR